MDPISINSSLVVLLLLVISIIAIVYYYKRICDIQRFFLEYYYFLASIDIETPKNNELSEMESKLNAHLKMKLLLAGDFESLWHLDALNDSVVAGERMLEVSKQYLTDIITYSSLQSEISFLSRLNNVASLEKRNEMVSLVRDYMSSIIIQRQVVIDVESEGYYERDEADIKKIEDATEKFLVDMGDSVFRFAWLLGYKAKYSMLKTMYLMQDDLLSREKKEALHTVLGINLIKRVFQKVLEVVIDIYCNVVDYINVKKKS